MFKTYVGQEEQWAHPNSSSQMNTNSTIAKSSQLPRIVVIGGGAGGLELVCRLAKNMSWSHPLASVVLVDQYVAHLWKPLLHEVAAGSLDANIQQADFAALACEWRFEFQQGKLLAVDRQRKCIRLAGLYDEEGRLLVPERTLDYDVLVVAIGSKTHFFNVPGAEQHAIALDEVGQAEKFHRRLIAKCLQAHHHAAVESKASCVHIVIVGGGATGVELAAELRNAAYTLQAYGMYRLVNAQHIRITLIDSGPRILGPLPEELARQSEEILRKLHVEVLTGEKVTEVREDAVLTQSGKVLPADLIVWAAGIRMPAVLHELGLAMNKHSQLEVRATLQSTSDDNIFALGDCASCPWPEQNSTVPPRAQAAHQQATFLAKTLLRHLKGKPLHEFKYQDHGSLLSLGQKQALGSIRASRFGQTLFIRGMLARWAYIGLYRMHLCVIHGYIHTALLTVIQWLRRKTAPRIKLH